MKYLLLVAPLLVFGCEASAKADGERRPPPPCTFLFGDYESGAAMDCINETSCVVCAYAGSRSGRCYQFNPKKCLVIE